MPTYEVIVGNLGLVHNSEDEEAAQRAWRDYAELSASGYGRVANEPVTLLKDDEIVREHDGTETQ